MGRFKTIVRAWWNKILGRTEQKYYDEILDLGYEDLMSLLAEVGAKLANVAQAKHRIRKLVLDAEAQSAKLESGASAFLADGQEDKAVEALDAKSYIDQQLVEMHGQLTEADARQKDLEATKKQLERQISQYQTHKELLKAEHAAAAATVDIAEAVTGIGQKGMQIGRTIQRMEESTAQLEARGDGLKELMASGALQNALDPGKSPLDRNVDEIERRTARDADLARLRAALPAAAKEKVKSTT